MSVDVDLKLDRAAVNRVLDSPTGEVGRFLEKKGAKAEQIATNLVPVDTGQLKSSISHKLSSDSGGLGVDIEARAPHALYVELGTRYRPATPYLRPAMRQAMSRI